MLLLTQIPTPPCIVHIAELANATQPVVTGLMSRTSPAALLPSPGV